MGRWAFAVCAALLLQACGTFEGTLPPVPNREVIGVSARQPNPGENVTPAPTAAANRKLDWEESQLCTLGPVRVSEAAEPGDADQQLVDRQVRCAPYEFSMFGLSFGNLIPPTFGYGPF
jgi:hypothetical protein